ncbi:hypothetical protein HK098_006746 [Nowakowskiella sp. JEL0407]|nr:hypothetical protein HK098_006746 [Nowakowskiella sp. JEL0407]
MEAVVTTAPTSYPRLPPQTQQSDVFTYFFNPSPINAQNKLPSSPWILPAPVIFSVLQTYFQCCNSHPTNFFHKSFLESWQLQPPELIYSMCALAAPYHEPFINHPFQYNDGNVFFVTAKKFLEFDDPTFETIMSCIILFHFCCRSGKIKSAWIYFMMIASFCGVLNLHIDPDALELDQRQSWTLHYKEMRRRVWWTSWPFARTNPKLIAFENNVKRPLPSNIVDAVPATATSLGAVFPTGLPSTWFDDMDAFSQNLTIIADRMYRFHEEEYTQLDSSFIFDDALGIYLQVIQWRETLPRWMKPMVNLEPLETNSLPFPIPSSTFWRLCTYYIAHYSLIIGIYRFALIKLCTYQDHSLARLYFGSNFSETTAYKHCEPALNSLIGFLQITYLRYDQNAEHLNLYSIMAVFRAGTYCAVVSRFGDTENVRKRAQSSFEFIKSLCHSLSLKSRWKIFVTLVSLMESIQSKASNEQCIGLIKRLMTNPTKAFEVYADAASSSNPAVPN